jgi:hypothetical protein
MPNHPLAAELARDHHATLLHRVRRAAAVLA